MKAFFLFALLWLVAWTIFLLCVIAEKDGDKAHSHTLLDDIEVEL